MEYYNTKRLHSALGYVVPKDLMEGRKEEIIKSREEKLRLGRQKRIEYYNKTYLTEKPICQIYAEAVQFFIYELCKFKIFWTAVLST